MKTEFEQIVVLYDQLLATLPVVERKGKSMPYTSVNGNMFSFLTSEGSLALRLSAADRDKFITNYQSKPLVQHGVVMKEYVEIPLESLIDTDKLSEYLKLSYEYVSGLKPKQTKRKTK